MSLAALLALLLAGPARAASPLELAFMNESWPVSGRVGVYARSLETGVEAALNADEVFPAASLIKVPLLAVLFDRLEKGELDYGAPLRYSSARAYPGEDLLASFQDGSTLTVSRLAFLMASLSDNTAALWVQELDGGGEAVNRWLDVHGYAKTRVNSRTPGREADKKLYGWGQTTPRELSRLMASIWQRECVSRGASAEMARVLSRSFWDGEALSALPPTVHAISKQGAVDAARGETLVVAAPAGVYVLTALSKDLKDTRWDYDQEGFVFLRGVSAAAWKAFNPESRWRAVSGRGPYWKRQ